MNNSKLYTVNDKQYNITISSHVLKRIIEDKRHVEAKNIIPSIISCIEKLMTYNGYDCMIIDYVNNFSMVVHINNNVITVVTIIDKVNVFIKSGTYIIEVK